MEIIYDGMHEWEGWGGAFRLGSGKCQLRLLTLKSNAAKGLISLKSTVALVSDLPESRLSVRACPAHIVTSIAEKFDIDVRRIMYVEYYPESNYGPPHQERTLPARYEVAEFTWHTNSAPQVKWHSLKADVLKVVEKYVDSSS